MPSVQTDDISMSGFMQETMINDGSKEQIVLVAQFETAGDEWVDNAFL